MHYWYDKSIQCRMAISRGKININSSRLNENINGEKSKNQDFNTFIEPVELQKLLKIY